MAKELVKNPIDGRVSRDEYLNGKPPKKDSFIHLSRRTDVPKWAYVCVKLGAILIAFLLCALFTEFVNPGSFGTFFESLINSVIKTNSTGTIKQCIKLLQSTALLLLVALALTPAFKMKFWNIGGEGQILIGALCAAGCLYFLKDLPSVVLIFVCLIAAVLGGIIWALIPALFKAFFNTNETLFTLMMNYIATGLVAYFIFIWVPSGSATMGIINSDGTGWLPKLFGENYVLNIILVAIITVAMTFYLKSSKHGYELSVVGESANTAKYVGINVKKVIIRTMILSGALCGFAGFLLVNGSSHTITTTLAEGRGFTAILIAWLSHFNPIEMTLSSLLVAFVDQGGSNISSAFQFGDSYPDVLVGIFFFTVIASEFFLNYKISFRKHDSNKKGGK